MDNKITSSITTRIFIYILGFVAALYFHYMILFWFILAVFSVDFSVEMFGTIVVIWFYMSPEDEEERPQ